MILLQAAITPPLGGLVFDGTINAGNVLTMLFGAIVWMVTIAVAWTRFGGRMDMLEFRVRLMEETLKQIASILEKFTTNERDVLLLKSEVASLNTDYATLHKTVEDLRRGKGFIHDREANSVNREY